VVDVAVIAGLLAVFMVSGAVIFDYRERHR
jgi:hypothetical protein